MSMLTRSAPAVGALALSLLGLLGSLASQANAQTADELIAKNLAARGGKDKIMAIQSARISGQINLGRGAEGPFIKEWRRPNLTRLEFTLMGMTAVQAYDGTGGWAIMPFHGGGPEPQAMPQAQLDQFLESADLDGPLVNPEQKGLKIEAAGQETIDGTPAFRLKLTHKNGDVSFLYLDAKTYLAFKEVGTSSAGGEAHEFERSMSDYKAVRGVLFSFAGERKPKGAISGQTTIVDKIELDTDEPANRFTMPKP